MLRLAIPLILLCLFSCEGKQEPTSEQTPELFLQVLGIAQDAGYPQIGCQKVCCRHHHEGRHKAEKVVSLGIVDKEEKKNWLFEATPDIKSQIQLLSEANPAANVLPEGIFLTHAHMGHYTGLMHLGREAFGAKNVKVYAMPRMSAFLKSQGPWSQLVELKNIELIPLKNDSSLVIDSNIKVTPLLVPHRDEFSETVGYRIQGPQSNILFIPDIDKWHKWDKDIVAEIQQSTHVLLDATFYDNAELPNRDMSEIPHPFVEESLALFAHLPLREKNKVWFIHFNHSNPLIWDNEIKSKVQERGFHVAEEGKTIPL